MKEERIKLNLKRGKAILFESEAHAVLFKQKQKKGIERANLTSSYKILNRKVLSYEEGLKDIQSLTAAKWRASLV